MPSPRREFSSQFPINISARTNNKEWFKSGLDESWSIFTDNLYLLDMFFEFRIHSFVLMTNHFHLIAQTPQNNMAEGMAWFMRETSKLINKKAGTTNHVFGKRYYSQCLKDPYHYSMAYKYNYRNPVKAGIFDYSEAYPYSTLHGRIGLSYLPVPIRPDETGMAALIPGDIEDEIKWLNLPFENELECMIEKTLQKNKFELKVRRPQKKSSHSRLTLLDRKKVV